MSNKKEKKRGELVATRWRESKGKKKKVPKLKASEECPLHGPTSHFKNSSKMAFRFQHFFNRHRFPCFLFNSWTHFLTQAFQLRLDPLPWYVLSLIFNFNPFFFFLTFSVFFYAFICLDSNLSCQRFLWLFDMPILHDQCA